jgi:hypothetical protein
MNKILHTSWGYDMTHNDFAKVIRETDKSVMCVMVASEIISGGGCTGKEVVRPEKEVSKPFRLLKRDGYYRGSYPFCGESKRLDSFYEVDPAKEFYYNIMD